MTLSNFTINQRLAFYIMRSKKAEFTSHEINSAFDGYCHTGRNRLGEMRKEWIVYQYGNKKYNFQLISKGYEWDPKTKKYILDAPFILWMNAKYVSKIIS